jgi:hypothetical protein
VSTQSHDFFGLKNKSPSDVIGKQRALAENFQLDLPTVVFATLATPWS